MGYSTLNEVFDVFLLLYTRMWILDDDINFILKNDYLV